MMRCNICNGNKQYAPLGYMLKTCFKCDGTGKLDESIILATPLEPITSSMPLLYSIDEQQNITKPKPSKKRKTKPVMHVDHPLNKLKSKIANANT